MGGLYEYAVEKPTQEAKGLLGKEQPPQPDYAGAAEATAEGNLAAIQAQTVANRPNMYLPGGSNILWNQGANGQWTMNMNLGPQEQAALEAQQRLGAQRSQLGETLFGRAQSELGAAPDWGSLPGAPNAETARSSAIDAVYGQASSRLDPQWNQRAESMRSQLLNEGLRPGMEGYDQRMQEFERGRTDAYDTAMRSAIMAGEQAAAGEFGRGLQGRQQGVAELLQRRGTTLNEINALLGGQQVKTPQQPSFAQAGYAAGPDYLQAAQSQYGADLNSYNAQQGQAQQNTATLLALLRMFA